MHPPQIDLDAKYVVQTYARQPMVLARGEGVWVWDTDGKRFQDWVAGIAVDVLGHSHPKWVAAIREQAGRLVHTSNLYHNEHQAVLAREIVGITGLDRVFFANSGTEANEAAIKIARRWAKAYHSDAKHKLITFVNSFHGRTYGGMSATGQEKYQKPFTPLVPGFVHVPADDWAALDSAADEDVCAIMVETIQGEGGVRPIPAETMRALRRLCDERNILLIVDEVQCGIGRTGKWMAYEHSGVLPDIVPLAKGLGGGFPIGACVVRGDAATCLKVGEHGSTFAGGPLACKAGLATLEIIREEAILENAEVVGTHLQEGLRNVGESTGCLSELRGMGLMLGLVLDRPIAKQVLTHCRENGLLINAPSDTLIRIVPPLVITKEEVDWALPILEAAIRASS